MTTTEAPPDSLADIHSPFNIDVPMGDVIPETSPETVETPPETAPPPPETPPVTKTKEPSRSQLQTELETRQAELEKLRLEGQQATQKYQDEVAKRTELEQKVADFDKTYVQKESPVYDWRKDPEVAGPRNEITAMVEDAVPDFESDDARRQFKGNLPGFLNAYVKARGEDGLVDYKAELIDKFGEDGRQMFSLLRQMAPKHVAAMEAQARNSGNHFQRVHGDYETRSRATREEFSKIAREAAEGDDIGAAIVAAIGGDEELLKQADEIVTKAAMGAAGLPPLPPNAPAEYVQKHREAMHRRAEFMERHAFRRDAQARILAGVVKKLAAENETLRKRAGVAAVAGRADSKPSDPTPPEKKGTGLPDTGFEEVVNPFANARSL